MGVGNREDESSATACYEVGGGSGRGFRFGFLCSGEAEMPGTVAKDGSLVFTGGVKVVAAKKVAEEEEKGKGKGASGSSCQFYDQLMVSAVLVLCPGLARSPQFIALNSFSCPCLLLCLDWDGVASACSATRPSAPDVDVNADGKEEESQEVEAREADEGEKTASLV
ncbi:hypothetical protein B0H34DRAFT_673518 [Crassisporium funariophilum]|nr:hypothetical protein B0H34DRAFT_673518 [Crassisporium funariophilum]